MKKFLVNSHRMHLKKQRKEITVQRPRRGKLTTGHQKKATHLRTLKQGKLNTFPGARNMMKVQTRMTGIMLYRQTLMVRRNQCSQIIMMAISTTKASLSMSMLMKLSGKMKMGLNMDQSLLRRNQHSQKKKNHQMNKKRKKLCRLKIKRSKKRKTMRQKLYIQLLSLKLQKLKRLKKRPNLQKMFQLIQDKMLVFGIQMAIAFHQLILKQSLITSG